MNSRAFYGRKTKVSKLAKACKIIEQSSDPPAIVVLPPAGGDARGQDSDIEKIPTAQKKSMNQLGNLR